MRLVAGGLAVAAALQPPFVPCLHAPVSIARQPQPPARHASARALLLLDDTVSTPPGEEADETDAHPWTKPLINTAAKDPYRVARRVAPMLVFHLVWTSFVVVMRLCFGLRWTVPWVLHSLLGGVLGLLLAFRTNQAFDRYWSACKCWAEVHRSTHTAARLAACLSDGCEKSVMKEDRRTYTSIIRHLIAFPIALKHHLRQTMVVKELFPVLWISEIDALVAADNAPNALLASLSMLLRPIRARDDGSGKDLALWTALEQCVGQLQATSSTLELLRQVPAPASYSLLVSRFVGLWVATLPLVLIDLMHPLSVPAALLLVAWALYSTEELAQLMEDPFGCELADKPETVPLDVYCSRIIGELKGLAVAQRALDRRVASGVWVVKEEMLDPPQRTVPQSDIDVQGDESDGDPA